MIILSLECAGSGCGVCVWQDGRTLALLEEKMERGQDSRLVPMVQEAVAKAGLTFQHIDRFAVTRGPGSFTGLRIGLATARGLAFASAKPVIGIDRFLLFKEQPEDKKQSYLVVIESRRLELYTRFFPAVGEAQEPHLLNPTEIAAFVSNHPEVKIVGDAFDTLRGSVDYHKFEAVMEAEAVTLARMAVAADPASPDFLPRPLYIRPPDVTVSARDDQC